MERWEGFYEDSRKVGALWRRFCGGALTTRVCFPLDGGYYRAESVVAFDDHGAWTTSTYRSDPGGPAVTVDRHAAGLPVTTVPSYVEYLLLEEMCDSEEPQCFDRFADGDAAAAPRRVVLVWADTETVDVAGHERRCRRLEVHADGHVIATHWADEEGIVKSDWNGAQSCRQDEADVVAGLDEQVLAFVRDGFGG